MVYSTLMILAPLLPHAVCSNVIGRHLLAAGNVTATMAKYGAYTDRLIMCMASRCIRLERGKEVNGEGGSARGHLMPHNMTGLSNAYATTH